MVGVSKFLGILIPVMVVLSGLMIGADGLSMDYYMRSCPFAEMVVRNKVSRALRNDPTLAAPLVRLHFHDCFIQVPSLICLFLIRINEKIIFLFRPACCRDVMGRF